MQWDEAYRWLIELLSRVKLLHSKLWSSFCLIWHKWKRSRIECINDWIRCVSFLEDIRINIKSCWDKLHGICRKLVAIFLDKLFLGPLFILILPFLFLILFQVLWLVFIPLFSVFNYALYQRSNWFVFTAAFLLLCYFKRWQLGTLRIHLFDKRFIFLCSLNFYFLTNLTVLDNLTSHMQGAINVNWVNSILFVINLVFPVFRNEFNHECLRLKHKEAAAVIVESPIIVKVSFSLWHLLCFRRHKLHLDVWYF